MYLTHIRLTLHESMAVFLAARLLARYSDKPNPHAVEALLKLGVSLDPLAPQIGRHIVQTHAVGERGRGRGQPTGPSAESEETAEQEVAAPPTAQMLYSRPTRSGTYGVVSLFAPWRIGLSTITYRDVNGVDRQRRFRLALQAYQVMFSRTDGAMTSTRLPHLEAFEGVLVISRTNFPVPVISPLKEGYREEIEALAQARGNAFECLRFDNLVEFIKRLRELENDTPYALTMPSS